MDTYTSLLNTEVERRNGRYRLPVGNLGLEFIYPFDRYYTVNLRFLWI